MNNIWFNVIRKDDESPDKSERMKDILSSKIELLPSNEKITISEAIELHGAPPLPEKYYKYLNEDIPKGRPELPITWHTNLKQWHYQGNPNHRAMGYLDQTMSEMEPKGEWLFKPMQQGPDKPTQGDMSNFKGMFWVASQDNSDSFLFNLDWNSTIHRDQKGVCVIKRGVMIPFKEYKFTHKTKTVVDNPEERPSGLLSQSLLGSNNKLIVDEERDIDMETKKAKMVYDFLSSYELTSGGPQYGETVELPRWTKVSIGLGSNRPRPACVNMGRDFVAPVGDVYASGALSFSQRRQIWDTMIVPAQRSLAGRRGDAFIYPLEKTMVRLNKEFPDWTGENENMNKTVLSHLEENNYFLGVTNIEAYL